MIKKLLPSIGKYKLQAILSPVTIIFEVLLEVSLPLLMGNIIDIGVKNKDLNYIIVTGFTMIGMALLSLIFGASSGYFAAIASSGFAKNLRERMFAKIQSFSFANVDKFSTGSLVMRVTQDVTNTQNAFQMMMRMLVRAPIMFVTATIMAVTINAKLSLIFLAVLPLLVLAIVLIASKAFPLFQKMMKANDSMNTTVQEGLIAIRVVKSFVRGDFENEKFKKSADDVRKATINAEKLLVTNMPMMQLAMYICMIMVFWFGAKMIVIGDMETGQLLSFISYISQILMSLMMVSMVFVMLVLSKASASRIVEVLDEKIDLTDDNADPTLQVTDGSVEFNNVSFSYYKDKNNLTLRDATLKINSGETVGIIGGTGSSKTTLVQLIPRLYDVLDGEVKVGGRGVKEYKMKTLRDAVAMVLQKNVLFSGTIKENLKWGNEDATDDEITEACKKAQAHNFIMSFPDGYETNLGQGGVNVSGGQKQRLCIARALIKKPKIIIFDDSTSAVDVATDAKIRSELKKNMIGMTIIIIAQRISSVYDADRIIVIDDGRINAIGTHEELLAGNEIYKEVYLSQQSAQQKGDK
ncbi:MAG: ABC transporter [Clostridiales bacterium GWF2_38_85]|nr:MAG: ABC transporter [Clostridiales bacterium GWF2_38_85]